MRKIAEDKRRRLIASTVWISLVLSLVALAALAVLNESVSTGWRLYVLAKIFKAGWGATVAMLSAMATLALLGGLRGTAAGGSSWSAVFQALRILTSFLAALAAFGYFMPDWNPWTALLAGIVLISWGLTALAAIIGR